MEEMAAQMKAVSDDKEKWVQKSIQGEQQIKKLNDVGRVGSMIKVVSALQHSPHTVCDVDMSWLSQRCMTSAPCFPHRAFHTRLLQYS
jgi:hypothetical protein